MTTVVIGCGKAKRRHPAPAVELYTGPFIKQAVRWARSIDARVLILSAKHGLIDGGTEIAPYAATFASKAGGFNKGDEADREAPVTSDVVHTQAHRLLERGERVVLLAGDAYADVLERATVDLDVSIDRPFRDLALAKFNDARQGYQMQLMIKYLGRLP